MSSEIRANTLKNRVGLSTINISNTGIVVSGVATATTFSGNLTGNVTGNINNSTLLLQTGGSERVRIASDGKVGIGTVATKELHVDGTIFASAATPSLDGGLRISPNNAGSTNGGVIYGGAHNDSNHAIFFRRGYDGVQDTIDINEYGMFRVFTGGALASQDERLRITSAGNVGIGTDAGYGDATLTVHGTAALTNNDTTLQIKDNVSDNAVGRGGNIGFSGYVNGTQRTFAAIGGLKSAAGTGDFSGDLALYTRANGQAELDERLRIDSSGHLKPATNDTYNLGTSSHKWANVYIDNYVYVGNTGSSFKDNQLLFKSSGTAYIDHFTTGQDIQFRTSVNSALDTSSVKVTSAGNVAFMSGKGIDFSANSNLAGMTGEVLDHYETGTYVPTWSSAATPSYYRNGIDSGTSSNGLSYVRIGNQVTVTGSAFWTGGTSINNVRPNMSLPFQARIYSVSGAVSHYSLGVTTEICYLNYDSTTSINLFVQTSNGLHGAFGDNTNGEMYFNITYMTY